MSKYLELAKKLKALSERGIDGEKENAAAALDKLMKKHDITHEMLEDAETRYAYFKVTPEQRRLFFQVVASVIGNNFETYFKRGKKNIIILKVTSEEVIEIEIRYAIFWKAYIKEEEIFWTAYVHKNNLHPKPMPNDTKEEKELSDEEIADLRKALELSKSIEKQNIHKQLTK